MTDRGTRALLLGVGPAFAYVAYIFVMGSIRGADTPMHVSDKTAHFLAFGLMVPLFARALRHLAPRVSPVVALLLAAALSSGAGALLEVWQAFIPWRSSDVWDWVADTMGAAAALLVLFGVRAAKSGEPSAR
ncbi:MAG TPA: VanZ family protein [Polyangiaceae bacterium]|nr:VanZ family protein [Polyangiaceae bacterium]